MRTLYILPLVLVLGGCAGLVPRLSDGSLDSSRIVDIASTVAETAVAGVSIADDARTEASDWISYGVGAILSLLVASVGGQGAAALYKSGRNGSSRTT